MRLTLRTLLAYLDDTLEPQEAKLIGQKVAESDTARELIARIKEVTRRRRITTPAPDGPGSNVDPDTIAAYLDNKLSAEQLAEVEQLALASDVHLAEIASCHQILTVVLGEPAVVPPTAYKRMYGLVKPPESNPQHSPPIQREAEEVLTEGKEVDETLRLGLPAFSSRGSWTNRLLLIGGAVCVLALLAVSIWELLPPFGTGDVVAKIEEPAKTTPDAKADKSKPATKAEAPPAPSPLPKKDNDTPEKKSEKDNLPADKAKEAIPKEVPAVEKEKKVEDVPPAPPGTAVLNIGQFEPPTPPGVAVLVQQVPDKNQPDRKPWTRLLRTADPLSWRVWTETPLVSLPGFRSVVQLDSGVRLTLWGTLPEIWPYPPTYESSVIPHPPGKFDADLTLDRGRIVLANTKDQALMIRLRFDNPSNPGKGEVWDITLDKGAEITIVRWGGLPPGEQFYRKDSPRRQGPAATVAVLVVVGSARVKLDLQPADELLPPPNGKLLVWDSLIGRPTFRDAPGMPLWVQPLPPLPDAEPKKVRDAVLAALGNLSIDLSGQSVEAGLLKAMASNDIHERREAVRCAAAMDDLGRVIDALIDKDLEVRLVAVESLRHWIGAGRGNVYKLFAALQPNYSEDEAEIILTLLHRWSPSQDADPQIRSLLVSYLTHRKVAIRELAHDYLLGLPDMLQPGLKIGYNALAPEDQLRQRALEWQKLVQQPTKK